MKNDDLIGGLRKKINLCLEDLVDEIRKGQPFSLLDFPDHNNVGDSAIYCGQLAYFSQWGVRPAYVSTKESYAFNAETLDRVTDGGPIFLTGGGNFGDVWPWFQPFREAVLAQFPGRPVVQMPVTIHFDSQDRLDQTARIIDSHGAYTLLVRDTRSYELATRVFNCDVRLCPDMAYHIRSVPSPTPTKKLLLHFRTDKEAARTDDIASLHRDPRVIEADWAVESDGWVARFDRSRMPQLGIAYLGRGRAAVREARYRGRAEARLQRGFKLLGMAELIITDRMHGHILSTLLGRTHCVLDNSYGKTSQFMQTWKTAIEHVYPADSVAQALKTLVDSEGLEIATG